MSAEDFDGLQREWEALRARAYAEQGVPMIVGVETVEAASPPTSEPELAQAFADFAEALQPFAETDPAGVLELMAARKHAALDRKPA